MLFRSARGCSRFTGRRCFFCSAIQPTSDSEVTRPPHAYRAPLGRVPVVPSLLGAGLRLNRQLRPRGCRLSLPFSPRPTCPHQVNSASSREAEAFSPPKSSCCSLSVATASAAACAQRRRGRLGSRSKRRRTRRSLSTSSLHTLRTWGLQARTIGASRMCQLSSTRRPL